MVGNTLMLAIALVGAQEGPADAAIDRVRASTVLIEVMGPRGRSTGSGFVVGQDGVIATAAHVLQGAWQARVRFADGRSFPVRGVTRIDRRLDMAFLDVEPTGAEPVKLGTIEALRPGQRLLALGCPFGMDISVSDGLFSAVQSIQGHRVLQVSIPVSPGNSGGPVFAEDGTVVGLVVSGVRGNGAENLNFALPIDYVTEHLTVAMAETPVPLMIASREELAMYESSAQDDETEAALPAVNAGLPIDYGRLDGVEMMARWKRQDGVRFTSTMRIGLSIAPTGERVIEQYRETRVNDGSEVGREEHRTVMRIGGTENAFSATVKFVSPEGRAREYSGMVEAQGERYIVSDGEGGYRTGRAPFGVVPPSMANSIIAAHQGPLGEVFEFLVLDAQRERLLPARFELVRKSTRKIPVSRGGTSCTEGTKVDKVEVEVFEGYREIGTDRRDVVVLAASPFLVLEENLVCVRFPAASRAGVAVASR